MNNVIIGIPAYNAEETLPTLLASIKTQTYKDYKVVIVADGDNKESLYDTIASSFVDNYEVVSLSENKGPGIARAKALEVAIKEKIPFITFMDADDLFFNPISLQQLVNGMMPNDKMPVIVEAFSPFLQMTNVGLVPIDNPDSPWVFGKMYNVPFLKTSDITFSSLRAMEDGEFNAKIRLIAPQAINILSDPTYIWMPGSEHSITRMTVEGNDTPIYNYGLCQIGADKCFASALEFAAKKNPLNPEIKKMAVQSLISHYFTYYEAKQNYECFADINAVLSRDWFDKVYCEYASDVKIDQLEEMFLQFTPRLQVLKKMPDLSFRDWLEYVCSFKDTVQESFDKLPKDIIEAYKRTGVLSSVGIEEC